MTLPPFASRALAVLILASALSLPAAAAWTLLETYGTNARAIEDQRRTLGKLQSAISDAGIHQRLSADPSQYRDRFMDGAEAAHLAANLQTRVKEIAESFGVEVLQVSDLKPKVQHGVTYAGILLNLSGPIGAVYETLLGIETSTPWLFIEAAHISANRAHDQDSPQPVILTLELAIITAVWPELVASPGAKP